MQKIRVGVLGVAKIATQKVIPAMRQCQYCDIVGIASRSGAKARAAADQLGLEEAYDSYEKMLADPSIQAIYNPLPNHLHVPWSLKALEAGKHVLCEKPIAPTAKEARAFAAQARQYPRQKVMEAFMYRFHPQWVEARRVVQAGELGQLRSVQTAFSYARLEPENVRNQKDMGGGGLLDIGCYPISLSRFLTDDEPTRVFGTIELDDEYGVDRLVNGILEFPRATATFTVSTDLAPFQRVQIFGTTGRFEIEIPFNAPPDRPCLAWKETESGMERLEFPICDQYTLQGDKFARAILEEEPIPTPLGDAVANMEVIDAILQSHQSGAWANVRRRQD